LHSSVPLVIPIWLTVWNAPRQCDVNGMRRWLAVPCFRVWCRSAACVWCRRSMIRGWRNGMRQWSAAAYRHDDERPIRSPNERANPPRHRAGLSTPVDNCQSAHALWPRVKTTVGSQLSTTLARGICEQIQINQRHCLSYSRERTCTRCRPPCQRRLKDARCDIHNEAALEAALRDRRIAGAGLDVFLKGPPDPGHSLLNMDNVIASPHIAGTTVETRSRSARDRPASGSPSSTAVYRRAWSPALCRPLRPVARVPTRRADGVTALRLGTGAGRVFLGEYAPPGQHRG